MLKISTKITILKELQDFVMPLMEEEFSQLKHSILNEGCRDSLVVWKKNKSAYILVDGHNRYKICSENNIPFDVKIVQFPDIDEAKSWMIDNQLGRRNLNPDQLSYYRGLKYLSMRKKKGGFNQVKAKGQQETSTSEALSEFFKVSESTIKRDTKFAVGLDIIGSSNKELKRKILLGETKIKKSDVQILSNLKEPVNFNILNEADLLNKAKILKDEILDQVENDVQKIEQHKVEKAQEVLSNKEPLFMERDKRLVKIKGMILSAINKAINNRNVDAINDLKRLIDRLEHELFE